LRRERKLHCFTDNPRRLGKSWTRLVGPAPLDRDASFGGGRIHQFLWQRSHAVIMRMRNLAARSDEKPLPAESSSPEKFRFRMNRSHPEGDKLLLCISTVRMTLAGLTNNENRPKKEAERPTKGACASGRPRDLAGYVKNFRAPAMLKTTPLDCERKAT
jgi:hypothetical protein